MSSEKNNITFISNTTPRQSVKKLRTIVTIEIEIVVNI